MPRIPLTDTAFDKWMQDVEDRIDRLERGTQQLRVGDVTIHVRRNSASGTSDVILTRDGGSSVLLVTIP